MAESRNGKTKTKGDESRPVPHSLEVEEALLGAVLLSADARNAVSGAVDADDFYRPIHGHILAAAMDLHDAGEAVDPLTVAAQLGRVGLLDAVGGVGALLSLQANTPASSSAARYARVVRDAAVLRRLIEAAGEIAERAYGQPDDVAAAVLDAAARLEALLPGRVNVAQQFGAGVSEWLDSLEGRMEAEQGAGVPSCWRDLDRLIVGLRPGQLVIVGGRPSMGKSQVLIDWAYQVAAQTGVPCLFKSLEMTREEVQDRVMAVAGRIDRNEIRRGQLREPSWMRLSSALGKIADLPLWIEYDPDGSVASVRAAARRVRREAGQQPVVFVDYLQLMSVARHAENRQVEVSELSRSMKRAAADFPIVTASQLSRKVDERADKRPVLSDLRESGSLEQDADVVVLVHRPEAYDSLDRPGEMDLIVAKQRNGPIGTATLLYDHKTGTLRDRTEAEAAEPLQGML